MDWLLPMRELSGFIPSFPESLTIIRVILGFILVFFLPGFAWTLVFLNQINIIERVAFSFGLSLVAVTLSLLLANWLIGLRITALNSTLVIIVVTILPVIVFYLKRFLARRGKAT